jgi:hypothetical protein
MNTRILRGLLPCALALASFPAFSQSMRIISQGPAFAFAEDKMIAEQIVDQLVGAPVGNGAQVVFFRPPGSGAASASLSEGETALAQLPSGAYYAVAVTPGAHTYTVNGNALQLDVAPGTRRFVRISNLGANPQMVPSQALTFLRLSMNLRPPLLN